MADLGNPSWSEIDASNNAIPPDGWPEGMQPSEVNNSARSQMGGEKRWWDRSNATQTTTGLSTAYVLTYASTQSALYDGEETSFVLHVTCGDNPTLNRDGLGAKFLRRFDFDTDAFIAVAAGEFRINQVLRVRYNLAADRYDIISPSSVDFPDPDPGLSTTGDVEWSIRPTAKTGWIFFTGSIGSATSGATTRANADAADLYAMFWDNYSNTLCPVATGRGTSAAADFAANKALTMLDGRGNTFAVAENMGGTNRGNLGGNSSVGGFSGAASLGESAGQKAHVQTLAELVAHPHNFNGDAGGVPGGSGLGLYGNGSNPFVGASAVASAGTSAAANVTQPTLALNAFIKL